MYSWNKSLLFAALGAGIATLVVSPASAADEKKAPAGPVTKAIAVITPTQGNKAAGKVTFTKEAGGVRVSAEITGLEPGTHGFHIHEFGDISAPDGASLGGHFNPHGKPHGGPDAAEHHAGDFGNIEADKAGHGKLDLLAKGLSLEGADSILGRGVVVHGKADDLTSQPAGNAGPRVGVGAIGVAKP